MMLFLECKKELVLLLHEKYADIKHAFINYLNLQAKINWKFFI